MTTKADVLATEGYLRFYDDDWALLAEHRWRWADSKQQRIDVQPSQALRDGQLYWVELYDAYWMLLQRWRVEVGSHENLGGYNFCVSQREVTAGEPLHVATLRMDRPQTFTQCPRCGHRELEE